MKRLLISSGSTFEETIAYSRAVVQGNWIFVSGTTGFNYGDMSISNDIAHQARKCFENIIEALEKANASLSDVVRISYIVPNASDFELCWPVLREFLGDIKPAATMISAGLADPRMKIEMEITALKS